MPAGLELYRTAVRLIERYRMHSTPVKLAVQADRTPIDGEWAACLFVDASRKAEKECLACRRYPLCRGVCCRGREFGRCAGAELLLQSLSGIFRICHFRTRTGGPAGADGGIRFLTPQKRGFTERFAELRPRYGLYQTRRKMTGQNQAGPPHDISSCGGPACGKAIAPACRTRG